MSKLSDCWRTPNWLFNKLNKEHGPFDIDLCATAENSKCEYFHTNETDYLTSEGELLKFRKAAFMNPPYSNPLPFIEKAWEDSKHCKIVCLVKCDPSTKWWSTFWEYNVACPFCAADGTWDKCTRCNKDGYYPRYNGPKPGCAVQFLPKRVKFDPPIGYTGKVSSPSFASAIVIMDRRDVCL